MGAVRWNLCIARGSFMRYQKRSPIQDRQSRTAKRKAQVLITVFRAGIAEEIFRLQTLGNGPSKTPSLSSLGM